MAHPDRNIGQRPNKELATERVKAYASVRALTPAELNIRTTQTGVVEGDAVFTVLAAANENASLPPALRTERAKGIRNLAIEIPQWNEEFLGWRIEIRNRQTNRTDTGGYILPTENKDQSLVILNNGTVFVGEAFPQPAVSVIAELPQHEEDANESGPNNSFPTAFAVDNDAYQTGNVINDKTASEIMGLFEISGIVPTLVSTNPEHIDELGDVVDRTFARVDRVRSYTDHMVGQAYDPVVEHVENILTDAGQMSEASKKSEATVDPDWLERSFPELDDVRVIYEATPFSEN